LEEIKWKDAQKGWEPLTEKEKAELDEAVRMVTNLNTKKTNEVLISNDSKFPFYRKQGLELIENN
jgi:hypothetical protein